MHGFLIEFKPKFFLANQSEFWTKHKQYLVQLNSKRLHRYKRQPSNSRTVRDCKWIKQLYFLGFRGLFDSVTKRPQLNWYWDRNPNHATYRLISQRFVSTNRSRQIRSKQNFKQWKSSGLFFKFIVEHKFRVWDFLLVWKYRRSCRSKRCMGVSILQLTISNDVGDKTKPN